MTALVPSSFAAPSGREGVVASVDEARSGSLVALEGVITGVETCVVSLLVTLSDRSGSVVVRVPPEVRRRVASDAFRLGSVMSLVGRRERGDVLAVRVAFDGAVGS